MPRHIVKPDNDTRSWAPYAYGLVGLPEGSELELRVLSELDGYNAADLFLIGSLSSSGSDGLVILYLEAIVKSLHAFFTGESP